VRYEKLIQGVALGKSVKQAGLDAGYAETTCEGKIYQIMDSPAIQRIRSRLAIVMLQGDSSL
jgi:hypothetical protein